jgi:hypothetical protein
MNIVVNLQITAVTKLSMDTIICRTIIPKTSDSIEFLLISLLCCWFASLASRLLPELFLLSVIA